jgi:CBS domain-containing protein
MDLSLAENTKRLKIYIGESDLWRGKPLYFALLEILAEGGMAGATVTRGIAGFGARSRIHTAAILRISEDLPLVIEVVDTSEKISLILEKIYPLVREGMMTLEDVKVIKYTHRYLNPLPSDKLVGEVMTREVKTLNPEQTVRQAWEKMLSEKIKAMPVINSEGNVVGILTDEDLMNRANLMVRLSITQKLDVNLIKEELDLLESTFLKVEDVMSKPVITVFEKSVLGFAVNLMKKHQLKRLPVTDQSGKLVGNLSRLDILRQILPSPTKELPPQTFPGFIHTISDIMSKSIPIVYEYDDIATVIHTLLENNSHRVIVIDENKRVSGILSDADVLTRLPDTNKTTILSAFKKLAQIPVSSVKARDLMTPNPIKADPDLPLTTAIRKMIAEERKWMVVVDKENHPVGLVDRQILLEALASVPPEIK